MKPLIYLFVLIFSVLQNVVLAQDQETFAQRKQILLDYMADTYTPPGLDYPNTSVPDPEKYIWPKTIARLEKYGTTDPWANERIKQFKTHPSFHFIFIGTARIGCGYSTAPEWQASQNSYLFYIWNRFDSYNAFTGEGTENHINMNRTSAYLFAQMSLNSSTYGTVATQRLDSLKRWVKYYSNRIFETGTGEWNSSVYGIYNLAGWLNLYDFAQDAQVRNAARAVLDFYATELALFYTQGTIGGPESRGMSMRAMEQHTEVLGWLWFGQNPYGQIGNWFWNGSAPITAVHAAVSSYRPPQQVVNLAQQKYAKPAQYHLGRPGYLLENPSETRIKYYIDSTYTLGTAFTPYSGYASSSYGTVNWKLVSRIEPGSDLLFSTQRMYGNGFYYDDKSGRKRMPYHQFAQHKNVMVQMGKLPTDAATREQAMDALINNWKWLWQTDFYQRFSGYRQNPVNDLGIGDVNTNGSFVSYTGSGNHFYQHNRHFIEFDKTYIALTPIGSQNNATPQSYMQKGQMYVENFAPKDSLCGFVLEAMPAGAFANIHEFISKITTQTNFAKNADTVTYTGLLGDVFKVWYQDSGSVVEPIYDWGYGATKANYVVTSPPFMQPAWPSGKGFGRLANWTINNLPDSLDKQWAPFDGPNIKLANKILTVSDGANVYTADCTADTCIFSLQTITTGLYFNQSTPANHQLIVYPNPADDLIMVNNPIAKGVGSNVTYKLFDLSGQQITLWTLPAPQQTVSLSLAHLSLKAGVYLLKSESNNGRNLGIAKVMIK